MAMPPPARDLPKLHTSFHDFTSHDFVLRIQIAIHSRASLLKRYRSTLTESYGNECPILSRLVAR